VHLVVQLFLAVFAVLDMPVVVLCYVLRTLIREAQLIIVCTVVDIETDCFGVWNLLVRALIWPTWADRLECRDQWLSRSPLFPSRILHIEMVGSIREDVLVIASIVKLVGLLLYYLLRLMVPIRAPA